MMTETGIKSPVTKLPSVSTPLATATPTTASPYTTGPPELPKCTYALVFSHGPSVAPLTEPEVVTSPKDALTDPLSG